MLTQIFNSIINTSITASIVIIFVIIARFLLKKSPKIFSYALWGVVLFRLVCPFTFESDFGLISSTKPVEIYDNITQQIVTDNLPNQLDFIPQGGTFDNYNYSQNTSDIESNYVTEIDNNSIVGGSIENKSKLDLNQILSYIWLVGFIAMLSFGVREFIKLHKSLIGCTRWKNCQYGDNIYLCDNIKSPFVMGLFKAKIYIPSNIMNNDLDYIISHEKHHILRLDHLTRIIGFITLSLHWFNPFVWIAFVLSGKDMELSCDEYVLKKSTNSSIDIRAEYSQALLYFACNLTNRRKLLAITPHAFGESGSTKERIKNIMTYKKTAVWVTVLLAGLVGFTSVALASDRTTQSNYQEITINPMEIYDPALINSSQIHIGNEFIDYIEIEEVTINIGGQHADESKLYSILDDTKTLVLDLNKPMEYPTLFKFNDENLYWSNLNNNVFEYNFSTQNIKELDINTSHFEVNSDWLIYSDDNLYSYNLNDDTTQIINEFKTENNQDKEKFLHGNFFVKFADDFSGNIVFFTDNSLVFYNPNTNEIDFEYQIDFNQIKDITKVLITSDNIAIICQYDIYLIDRDTKNSKLIELSVDNIEFIDKNNFLYSISSGEKFKYNILTDSTTPEPQNTLDITWQQLDGLHLTVLNENNQAITNANILITPLYVTDQPYETFLATDNNGVAQGNLNEIFPTGEYKIEVWIYTENGFEKYHVNQKITGSNYQNLVVNIPTSSQNNEVYSFENRTDIYIVDLDEKPIVNAYVELSPTFPVPAISSPMDNTINKNAYTDSNGRVTFINSLEGEYILKCTHEDYFNALGKIYISSGENNEIFAIFGENTITVD